MKEKIKINLKKEIDMKKVFDIAGMLILISTIITFSIIVGGTSKELPILQIAVLTGTALVVLLIKKIIYKEKLIKNKVDIAVLCFMGTVLLPFIFKTYCTYQGTVEFILKYFFAYSMYLLVRNVVNTKKRVNVLVATTIFSSLVIIVFGFDMLYDNKYRELYKTLDLLYDKNYRFTSSFGYANAVSIYITFCVFLAINRIENVKNILVKIIYIAYVLLGTYIIYISYSRFVLILYVLSILAYLIYKIYKKVKNNKKILKRSIAGITLFFLVFVIYLGIAMNYSKPHEMKLNSAVKLRTKFEPNKEYTMKLDLEVFDDEEETDTYLKIGEKNDYLKETNIVENKLKKGRQELEFKVTPTEDVYYLKLKIINENKTKNKESNKVIINKFYIDGEEYIISYKYIPTIISRLITSFNGEDESIHQRKQFYENCLRMAKDSPIIGHGGNAWKRLALAYEEYPYSVKETHSYFFELLICYGIIGVIAFLAIIVLFSQNVIKEFIKNKEKRKRQLSTFIGLMLFIIYSLTFDFSMSFVLTIFIVFLYLAILQFNENNKNNENEQSNKKNIEELDDIKIVKDRRKCIIIQILDWSSLIAILVIFIVLTRANIAKYIIPKENSEAKSKMAFYINDYNKKYFQKESDTGVYDLDKLKELILKEPYLSQVDNYKKYWNIISKKYKEMDEEELNSDIDWILDIFKKVKQVSPMYFSSVINRAKMMENAVKILENINNSKIESKIEELKKIMKEEAKINIENIKDTKRHYNKQEEVDRYLKKYNELLQSVEVQID